MIKLALFLVSASTLGACSSTPVARDSEASFPTLDATDSPSPFSVVVETTRQAPPEMSDCQSSAVRVTLIDGEGGVDLIEVGTVTGMRDEEGPAPPVTAIEGGVEVAGEHCAGSSNRFAVKHEGDALVAIESWEDSESGPGTKRIVLARLPSGATLSFR